jgi:general secretion pathway protein J
VTDPQAPPRVLFTGSAQSLRLFAPAPGSMGGSSCTAQLLTVHRDGKLQRLRLSIGDTHSDLVRGARAVALAYLPRDGDWRDDWAGEPVLPVLVRVRVAFPPGDTRVWPELFIAPRISAGADCTYDPATKSCRGM